MWRSPGIRPMRRSSVRRSAVLVKAVLCLGAFTTALNTTLLSPLLPAISDQFGISIAAAGQLSTTTAAFAAATALVMAPWLDRRSRALWLRLESLLLLAATLLTSFTPSLPVLFAARALAGIGGAFMFGVCLAATSELFVSSQSRNLAVGIVGTSATLGALVGLPLLALLEERLGWQLAVAATGVLPILLLVGSRLLPSRSAPTPEGTRGSWLGSYRRLLGVREATSLQAANIALSAVWFGSLIYIGAFARTELGYGADALALLYIAGGLGEIAGNLGAPLLLRRLPARLAGAALGALLAAALLLLALTALQGGNLFALMATISLAGAGLFTVLNILVIDALPDARGVGTALISAGFEIGGVVGVGLAALVLAISGSFPTTYAALGVIALCMIGLIFTGRPQEAPLPARSMS